MNRYVLYFLLLICCFSVSGCKAANAVKVVVYVYEETGEPISDAIVDFSFSRSSSSKTYRKKTNKSGLASAESKAIFTVPVTIYKEGYYTTRFEFSPARDSDPQTKQLVLRKIGTPIPLFAKRYLGSYPVKDKLVYFDFAAGDWVKPYGAGSDSHIGFIFHSVSKSIFEFEGSIIVSFHNDGDGLLQQKKYVAPYSEFKMKRFAPDSGYISTLEISKSLSGLDSSIQSSSSSGDLGRYGMFIRTNSVKNLDGQVVTANYAKIYGEIEYSPYHEDLAFTYYYNPSVNSLNLELDLEKNMSVYNSSRERIKFP